MTIRFDYKIPAGKLLRLLLEVEGERLLSAAVRGDFFAHPEELFEEAEASLAGLPLAGLPEAARAAFSRPGLSLYGVSPADIALALGRSLGEA